MKPSLGSPTLVLVPTELERARLVDAGGFEPGYGLLATCGFGPVAAAARCAQLLSRLRPARVLLVGICGAYDIAAHPTGTALEFGAVAIEGVGAGEGERFQGPPALGFPQWPDAGAASPNPIYDRLPLAAPRPSGLLLSTCAASDSPAHAGLRRQRFPDALAEDMEGFAVALACALAGVPLRVVRGVSNEVGVRDPASWRIPAALAAARRLAGELLASDEPWGALAAEPGA